MRNERSGVRTDGWNWPTAWARCSGREAGRPWVIDDDWGAFALLEVAVPRAIEDLRHTGGPYERDWDWARSWAKEKLGPHGESLLYRITDRRAKKEGYDTATMFADLARVLAILSFLPGGSRFGEMRWEVVA